MSAKVRDELRLNASLRLLRRVTETFKSDTDPSKIELLDSIREFLDGKKSTIPNAGDFKHLPIVSRFDPNYDSSKCERYCLYYNGCSNCKGYG